MKEATVTNRALASCQCGESIVTATKPLTARLICHCTFCQEFTGLSFSDVTAVRGRNLEQTGVDHVSFAKWRRLPPNLSRGRCTKCGDPILERSGSGPMTTYFVPTARFAPEVTLPPVAFHAFYDRRVCDVGDDRPKYDGFWRSQFAIIKLLGSM